MTRRYGRSERGQRIREAPPGGHWRTVTMLGAISSDGWQATMTIAAPADGDAFWLICAMCSAQRCGRDKLL